MKPYNNWDKGIEVTMEKGDYAFHGDVGIFCEELPENFSEMKRLDDNILALGEATNHNHRLFGEDIELRECPKTEVKYLRLVKPAALRHQEHKEILINPGTYRIGIQKEYDHFEEMIRQVQD